MQRARCRLLREIGLLPFRFSLRGRGEAIIAKANTDINGRGFHCSSFLIELSVHHRLDKSDPMLRAKNLRRPFDEVTRTKAESPFL